MKEEIRMGKLEKALNKIAKFTFVKAPKAGVRAGNAVRKGWKKK
jgi:hypothetical protein